LTPPPNKWRKTSTAFQIAPQVAFSCIIWRTLKEEAEAIEVHFTAETEQKLKDIALQSGSRTADKLVRGVVEGYADEPVQASEMLDSRYADLKSGGVKPIPGDDVEAYFRVKTAVARRLQAGS
jgi:hypothetical protein